MNRISEFYNLSNGERIADSQLTLDFLDALAKSGLRVKSKTRTMRRRAESWTSSIIDNIVSSELPEVGTKFVFNGNFHIRLDNGVPYFICYGTLGTIVEANRCTIIAKIAAEVEGQDFINVAWKQYATNCLSDHTKWIKDFWKVIKVVSVP